MALEGCYGCIKYLMFAFNFLFWILGCVILGIGIWVKVDPASIKELTDDDSFQKFVNELNHYGYESYGAYALIAIGTIIMLIGFLGCCGAIRESQCMLATFFIFLSIVFIALLVAGVYVIITKGKLQSDISKALKRQVEKSNIGDQEAKKFLRVLQDKLQCCGADSGSLDYIGHDDNGCQLANKLTPCSSRVYNKLSQNFVIIGGVAIGIAAVMLLGMIFSMLLCCAIRENMMA